MPDVMERLNLNVPKSARQQLKKLAKRSGRTEAEIARLLLLAAIEEERRKDFYRAVAELQTPALRARDLAFIRAFEALDG
jgi:predicted DNA-binding protein